MAYYLVDVNGKYLGDFTTPSGLEKLYKYAMKIKAYNLAGFLEKGAALVTTVLVKEIQDLRPQNPEVKEVLNNLIQMLNVADLCVIITDGAQGE